MFSGLGRLPDCTLGTQKIVRILASPAAVLAAGKNIFRKGDRFAYEEHTDYLALLTGAFVPAAAAQTSKSQAPKYPPIEEYLTPRPAEIALAKSAGPASISDRAAIKVLTTSGFTVVHQGDNGFVCMVMRGFSAPTYTPAQFRDLVYD